jgi:hypothetical protein
VGWPLRERRLVLAAGLVAALPIFVATVDVATSGWRPLADDALIAIRAHDVFTSNSPLLGPWSSGYTAVVGEDTFHPGPLLFWLLAVPARVPWPPALEVTAGLVNVACVCGTVALAHRRGGRPLMFATAIAIPIMLGSLPAETYSDIWNPSVPLLPFALLVFVAWSVACGDYRLLPLMVLLASFVPQCHLTFLVPAAAATAVGIAGLLIERRRSLLGAPARAWVVGALVVGALAWSAPVIDQATNQPGNLRLIYRAVRADQPTVGLDSGVRAVVHTVGVVPWWLGDPQFGLDRVADLTAGPGALTALTAVLALAGLAAILVVGWRRRRADVATAGALGLGLCAAAALVTASTPLDSFDTLTYGLRWTSPVGMWVWLALGWSAATLLPLSRLVPRRLTASPGAVGAGALGVAAVAGLLVSISGGLRAEPYDETRALADRVVAEVPPERRVGLSLETSPDASFVGLNVQAGIAYALRDEGRSLAAPLVASYIGREYLSDGTEQPVHLAVGRPPPADQRVIARVAVETHPEPQGAPTPVQRYPAAVSLGPEAQR